jgi:enoyl-CoA hydratase/carnithine racemase
MRLDERPTLGVSHAGEARARRSVAAMASDDQIATGDGIAVQQRGAALWIRMDRPQALNAFTLESAAAMSAALHRAEDDPSIRVVVVTGNGRAFCAGADLRFVEDALSGVEEIDQIAFSGRIAAVFNEIEASPLPVIAAVNGVALAAGLELLLSCDLAVAARSVRIGDGHAVYGLLPGGGSSVRLPRRIGVTRAKHLLYTGDLLPADELERMGLLNAVVADDELEPSVDALAAKLAERSPLGLARMKQLVRDGMEQPVETGMRLELALSDAHRYSHDMREGLAAFLEKRRPNFTGG